MELDLITKKVDKIIEQNLSLKKENKLLKERILRLENTLKSVKVKLFQLDDRIKMIVERSEVLENE